MRPANERNTTGNREEITNFGGFLEIRIRRQSWKSNAMDLSPFKKDIDELLDEFSGRNVTTLEEIKKIWRSRHFSFIFDAKPYTNLAFFMQSLYAHVICHIISGLSLSQRVGALYCLYCLHETQPFKPAFHIYLSLSELKKLKDLVRDAKQNGIKEIPALVRRMLSRNMFLFGFVDKNDDAISERTSELTKLHGAQLRVASDKLLLKSRLGDHIHMDMAASLGLEELKKVSKEYATAKKLVVDVAGKIVPIGDISHIVNGDHSVGDGVEKIADTWEVQKQQLYQQIGTEPPGKDAENNCFHLELEALLSE